MNAKVATLTHYRNVEEIAKAQDVIRELRGELHAVICEIQRTASAIRDVDALIARAKATLSRTGDAALSADSVSPAPSGEGAVSAGGVAWDLDSMSKAGRANELRNVMLDICGVKP